MHRQLREQVLERDGYLCQDCHKRAQHVHHIMALSKFGKRNKGLAWDEKNMISLCATCHIPNAHTKKSAKRYIAHLKELYGYDYTDHPWCEFSE